MLDQTLTRTRLKQRVAKLSWTASGCLIIAGLALVSSLILMGPGILLIMLGAVSGLAVIAVAATISVALTFEPNVCPFCHKESQVLPNAKGFWCDYCGSYVRIASKEDPAGIAG